MSTLTITLLIIYALLVALIVGLRVRRRRRERRQITVSLAMGVVSEPDWFASDVVAEEAEALRRRARDLVNSPDWGTRISRVEGLGLVILGVGRSAEEASESVEALLSHWRLDEGALVAPPVDYAASHGAGARSETDAKRAREKAELREREAMPEEAKEATHVADRVQGLLDRIEYESMLSDTTYEDES